MRNVTAAILACITLAGCGGTARMAVRMNSAHKQELVIDKMVADRITASVKKVPAQFLADVKGELDTELAEHGLLAMNNVRSANRLNVNITYYRMRGGFSRAMFGALAGKDGIAGTVAIVDAKGRAITTMNASSFNVMAGGGPDYIAREFAKKVVGALEKSIAHGSQ